MKTSVSIWILLIFSICISNSYAEIYKYVDDKGIIRYTNQKPPDSARVIDSKEEIPIKKSGGKRDALPSQPSTDDPAPKKQSSKTKKDAGHDIVPGETPCSPKVTRKSRGVFVVNCYEFNISAQQTEDMVQVSGRVRFGPYCSLLSAKIYLKNEQGHKITLFTEIPDVGGPTASRLIDDSIKLGRYYRTNRIIESWKITDIEVSCDN